MHHLLPLAAVLLLSTIPTETKVVTSVKDCEEFFLDQTPPKIMGILVGGNILDQNRYKLICQTFDDTRTFVTLYDTHNKIPVFSAAKFRGSTAGRPSHPWMIEPQAGDTDYNPYNQQGFDRGHLFPNSYACDLTEKKSTFTLTNVVPQNKRFNRGKWKKMELCVKKFLDENCINNNNKKEGFVVIGAKPSDSVSTDSSLLNNNKINIPSVLWSAFCCYSRSQNTLKKGKVTQNEIIMYISDLYKKRNFKERCQSVQFPSPSKGHQRNESHYCFGFHLQKVNNKFMSVNSISLCGATHRGVKL
uniref:Uncharacterized protein n=1 Tax=Pundamilia nyererei TaxID=303518 RepID=A0A3B4H6N0_9CICH